MISRDLAAHRVAWQKFVHGLLQRLPPQTQGLRHDLAETEAHLLAALDMLMRANEEGTISSFINEIEHRSALFLGGFLVQKDEWAKPLLTHWNALAVEFHGRYCVECRKQRRELG